MNRLKCLLLALVCSYALTVGGFASSGWLAASTQASAAPVLLEIPISVAADEVLVFTAADLERRLGYTEGELRGATVTALPAEQDGALFLFGVEVEQYQFLTRGELDELCFVARDSAVTAGLTLQPQGSESVPVFLSISVLETVNHPPSAEGGSFATIKGSRLHGSVEVSDPDGDAVSISVLSPPRKGDLRFDGVRFVYTPFHDKTGGDSFVYCAIDRFGNYSNEATCEIRIESGRSGFRYADMANNPSEYAAIKLHEKDVYTGEQVGGAYFFHPQRAVTRAELLVMTLAAAGLDKDLPAAANTWLEGDELLPMWLKPYVKKAIDEGIWNRSDAFVHDQAPTRAEAVLMIGRAAKITDVKDYDLQIGDLASIPRWALPSYKDLAAYRMLDLHDGNAYPDRALDTAYTADLIWQLYKHAHR